MVLDKSKLFYILGFAAADIEFSVGLGVVLSDRKMVSPPLRGREKMSTTA